MKLEAVMENLQRQQTARLALEEKLRHAETKKNLRSLMEAQIHQQAAAFRHYQTAMRGALTAEVANSLSGVTLPHVDVCRADDDEDSSRPGSEDKLRAEGEDVVGEPEIANEEECEDAVGLNHYQHRLSSLQATCVPPPSTPMFLMTRVPATFASSGRAESPSENSQSQHPEWTYEEQFKQVRKHSRTERFICLLNSALKVHSSFC